MEPTVKVVGFGNVEKGLTRGPLAIFCTLKEKYPILDATVLLGHPGVFTACSRPKLPIYPSNNLKRDVM